MNPTAFLQSLISEPWQLRPQAHQALCEMVRRAETAMPATIGTVPGLEQHSSFPTTATAEELGISLSAGYAFLPISGVLDRNADYWMCKYFGMASLRVIERQLEWIAGRADVHTLVLLMNSPGGRVPGGPEIASMIAEIGLSKRTAAWIDTVCCSLAYRIAAPCHTIYMPPSSVVGSISTILALIDSSGAWEQMGLKHEIFTDGDLKDLGAAGRPLSAAHKAHLDERLAQVGGEFKLEIAARRPGIPIESMNGGDYTGEMALSLGYVDGFARSLTDFVAHLIDTHRSH